MLSLPAAARTLSVGPGAEFAQPSQAAVAAQDGDHVHIAAGTYYDCAVWRAASLVIEGAGPATRLTDATCQGKAIMVVDGRAATIRDLTLARARVPDGNGAGIRAEAPDLTVQRVRFEDDQVGLLAGDQPLGTLRIGDSAFSGIAVASLVVGRWARLDIAGTRFARAAGQAVIRSDAEITEIATSRIEAGTAVAGAAVQAGGGLTVTDTALTAGRGPQERHAAVLALPARDDAAVLSLHRVTLQGGGTLLLNWSGRSADLAGNSVGAEAVESSSAGAWSFRLRRSLHGGYDALHAAAGALHRRLLGWLH